MGRWTLGASLGVLLAQSAWALQVTVMDAEGEPLEDAVVWVSGTPVAAGLSTTEFIMDQKDREFVPHVLPVPLGSRVAFPNSDSIMHHVYSFSPVKTFEIKLYKETPREPLLFDKPGVVEVGCNIHDWMLGYIIVVDGGVYAQTNAEGVAQLSAPAQATSVSVWHSRFARIGQVENHELAAARADTEVVIRQPLKPPLQDYGVDEFDAY